MVESTIQANIKGVDEALLGEIVRKIVENFQPHRIILFGSRARGGFLPDSDVDLFVEMESEDKPSERQFKIRSLFPSRHWSLDLVVCTPEETRRHRNMISSIIPVIEAEGRLLYGR